ncbi:MAG: hypothetical protein JRJ26_05155 [Deltaproteobacteria bacterium]|nr:hypothetical protein [Deltaproteobacteria bacterium]
MTKTIRQLAIEYLQEEVNAWAGTNINEMPSLQREYHTLEYHKAKGAISEREYLDYRQKMWDQDLPPLERAIKDFICFSLFRERAEVLEAKARAGDQEARDKLGLAFTKAGHVTQKALGVARRGIRQHNANMVFWLLRHQDVIREWTLTELVDKMEACNVRQDQVPIPPDTQKTDKLVRGELYAGHAREKFTERIRKLLNEMKLRTKGSR